jgi:hypothetical protein
MRSFAGLGRLRNIGMTQKAKNFRNGTAQYTQVPIGPRSAAALFVCHTIIGAKRSGCCAAPFQDNDIVHDPPLR